MRIATSTIYDAQTASIDNLTATYQMQGQELSSGKSLNVPSDNPTVIAQDLTVRADNTVQTQIGQNLSDLNSQLTTVDGALASLSNVLQSARNLAVEGANDTTNATQRQDIAQQIDALLQETIGLANTQYNGKYVFGGTNVPSSIPLVQTQGSPISAVTSQGNVVQQTQELPNGTSVPTGVTLQQAFNFGAADGSPDVFQTLINLRDTMQNSSVVDESAQRVNLPGTTVATTTTVTQLSTGAVPQILATPLQPDSTGNVTINIANSVNPSGVNVTFLPGDTMANVITKINAAANAIGISATYNYQTQRLSLTSTTTPPSSFQVNDVPSAGATNSSNFLAAFGLQSANSAATYLSTQLGDIDHSLNVMLNARSVVGATMQTVTDLSHNSSSRVLNDTAVQSNLEDADIAKVTSDFSKTQTVLQAAYATTSRLEGKTLFDYL